MIDIPDRALDYQSKFCYCDDNPEDTPGAHILHHKGITATAPETFTKSDGFYLVGHVRKRLTSHFTIFLS